MVSHTFDENHLFLQWNLNAAQVPFFTVFERCAQNISFYNEFVNFSVRFDQIHSFLQWILNAARTPVLCGLRTWSRNLSFYNEFVHFLIKFDQIHLFLQWIMKAAQTSLFCGLRTPPRLGGAIWEELSPNSACTRGVLTCLVVISVQFQDLLSPA